jgi:hypothetical protein
MTPSAGLAVHASAFSLHYGVYVLLAPMLITSEPTLLRVSLGVLVVTQSKCLSARRSRYSCCTVTPSSRSIGPRHTLHRNGRSQCYNYQDIAAMTLDGTLRAAKIDSKSPTARIAYEDLQSEANDKAALKFPF